MKWKKLSDYCIRSEDEKYTVCKIVDKFEPWFGKEQLAVNLDTADASRAFCEAHAAKQVSPTAAMAAGE